MPWTEIRGPHLAIQHKLSKPPPLLLGLRELRSPPPPQATPLMGIAPSLGWQTEEVAWWLVWCQAARRGKRWHCRTNPVLLRKCGDTDNQKGKHELRNFWRIVQEKDNYPTWETILGNPGEKNVLKKNMEYQPQPPLQPCTPVTSVRAPSRCRVSYVAA